VQRLLNAAVKLPGVKRVCLNFSIVVPAILIVFLNAPVVHSAQVTLAWDYNQGKDIAGYRLYYGKSSGIYSQVIDVGSNNQHKLSGLQAGVTYYFVVTAYDSASLESDYSKELVHTTGAITHTITVSAGANGRITPDGPVTVNQGTNQTFSMHPDPDYQVLNVKVDGVSLGTVTKYSFNNITADHAIAATFAYIGPAPSTDSDNDGMPDDWEIIHGLNPLLDDAVRDPDADGISNLNEYLGGTDPNIFEEFFKPEQPDLLSPSDAQVVPLTPVLQTGAFTDPDPADIHRSSRWQIFRSEDQVCVFDKISYASRTELVVPRLLLNQNTSYEWRVKFEDNHGLSSEWSETVTFITENDVADANDNGIPDHQEVAPNTDLDEDGTPDNDQNDIKSVSVAGESTQIGISILNAGPVLSIVALEAEYPEDVPNDTGFLDQTAEFPYGLISFKLIVSQPGDEVAVTLHLSRAASQEGTWYKFDPVENIWYDYSAYTEFSIDRKRIYLTLKDGGSGDTDGIENGIIVDPSGLSVPSSVYPAAADAVDEGGGGGGGGCFISAATVDCQTNSRDAAWNNYRDFLLALTLMTLIFFWVKV